MDAYHAPDYYNIDDILSEHQKVPCFFKDTVPLYGFLEGTTQVDLQPGVKTDLPFWLAEQLALNEFAELDIPKCFNQKTKNDFDADPKTVDLARLNIYFYRFGKKLTGLIDDEELERNIFQGFRDRLVQILGLITTKYNLDGSPFYHTLDETERSLLRIGIEAEKEMTKWSKGQANMLEPSPFLLKKF